MAFSAVFSPSCTLQTQRQSSLLSVRNSHSLSPTTSFFPPQPTQKFIHRSLRHKRISPIGVNPKRSFSKVKALEKDEKRKSYNNVKVFSKDQLAVVLAHDIAQLSKKYIQERGFFTVALPGGSLIKYLRKLVEPPYVDSIEWSKWHFFWVEERVLPKDHLDSNFKLAYDRFLSKVPNLDEDNIHSIEGYDLPADEAAEVLENKLRLMAATDSVLPTSSNHEFPKFDLMLLQMGPNGDADYIFPEELLDPEEEPKWVTFTTKYPKPPRARIAFTLPVINACSNITMVVSGAGKADAVYSVLEDRQKAKKLPVEMVEPEGELKWYLDEGAASKLKGPN